MPKRVNSREKGKRGEREARDLLRFLFPEFAEQITRGQQHKGGPGSPDVMGVPGAHVEAKRRARIAHLDGWMRQAITETGDNEFPVVLCRADRGRWFALLTVDTWAYYHRLRLTGMGVLP